MGRRDGLFSAVLTEGGLLPTDLLALIAQGDKSIPGVSRQDYHLVKGEQFGLRITDSWKRLRNAWKDLSVRLAAAAEMDTLPIVKRKDEAAHGEYRTKRLMLEYYDALAAATASGMEYQTVLNPPPADPSCAHPESTRPEWAKT